MKTLKLLIKQPPKKSLREVISLNCTNVIAPLMSPNTILLTALSMYGSLPDTVVTAASLLSFRHQLAKFDLSSFLC